MWNDNPTTFENYDNSLVENYDNFMPVGDSPESCSFL